jgi:hypothetical protein
VRRGGVGEDWYRVRRRPKFIRALLPSISKLSELACSFLIPLALLCLLELLSLEEVAAMLGRPRCRVWLMVTPLAPLCLLGLVMSLAEVMARLGGPRFRTWLAVVSVTSMMAEHACMVAIPLALLCLVEQLSLTEVMAMMGRPS